MKKSLGFIFSIILFASACHGQSLQQYKTENLSLNNISPSERSMGGSNLRIVSMIFPFNPIIAVEDGKVYFGFTKEVIAGIIGYGHIASEYSYLFRSKNNSHLRFSYNYDIVTESGDLGGFLISAGGGYFTDFNKKGIFPQISFNALMPVGDDAAVMPYVKVRYTFMTDKIQSNIFDFSLGLKTAFYF